MSIAITINGVDRTTRVEKDSLNIQNILTRKRDRCDFSVLHSPSNPFTPEVGQEVVVSLDGTRVFGGIITLLEQETTSYKLIHWKIECEDYTRLLDRKIIPEVYENQTIDEIIADLLTRYFPTGFSIAGVDAPITVKYVNFSYKPLSKCIELMADYAGYDWYVDPNKVLYFFKPTTLSAPIDIEDANNSHVFESLRIRRDNSQVRNSIVVRGGEYLGANFTGELEANGTDYAFPLPYRFTDFRATLTGEPLSLGIDYIDDPNSFDALYNFQEKVLKFKPEDRPSASSDLVFSGYPHLPVIVKLKDPSSISTFSAAEGPDGVYEYLILDKSINTREGARQRAMAELTTYATTLSEGEFETTTPGFRAGQKVRINSVVRGIDEEFIVNKVVFQQFDADSFKYLVSLVTTKTFDLIDLLMKLALDKTSEITISPDETADIVFTFADEAEFTDAMGSFTASFAPYYYASAWMYKKKITINSSKVSGGGTISNFVVKLDLADLGDDFWDNVQSAGQDIRIYKSDNATQVPFEIVDIDVATKTGFLYFKGDVSGASNLFFYIWFGNALATAYAASDTYGSQNVWTGHLDVYHLHANANDSAVAAKNGTMAEVSQGDGYADFPGEVELASSLAGNTAQPFGKVTTYQKIAQSFVMGAASAARIDALIRKMTNGGTPTSQITVSIQANSGGSPSGTPISSANITATNWNTEYVAGNDRIIWSAALTSLVQGTTYWLVFEVNTPSDTNFYNLAYDATAVYGVFKSYDGAAWNVITGSLRFAIYKSGYIDISSAITPAIQDAAVSLTLKKTDTNYETMVNQLNISTTGHFEINGQGGGALAGRINYRPLSGNQVTVSGALNTADGAFHYITLVRDATSTRFYVDGVLYGTGSTDATGTNSFQRIGMIANRLNNVYGNALKGQMKELRFSVASLITAAWIATRYNNESSPSTFYTVGGLEDVIHHTARYGFSTYS